MNIVQYIIVRKDILEIHKEDLMSLSIDRKEQYNKELAEVGKMNRGKLSAQVAHGSMAPILMKMRNNISYTEFEAPKNKYSLTLDMDKKSDLSEWIEKSFAKVVLYVKSEEALLNLHTKLIEAGIVSELIKDEGRTAFKKPTYTCLGIEPLDKDKLIPFVKKLRLLD